MPRRKHAVNKLRQILIPSLLTGLIAVFLLQVRPFSPAHPFRMLVKLTSDTEGRARLAWESIGSKANLHSDATPVAKGAQVLVFNVPDERIKAFALWPVDRAAKVSIRSAVLLDPENEIVFAFRPDALFPTVPTLDLKVEDGSARFTSQPGEGVCFGPSQPLNLTRQWLPFAPATAALQLGAATIAVLLILLLADSMPAVRRARMVQVFAKMREDQAMWPNATLLFAAAIATALSCYPVIFAGKSFVAPNNGETALYEDFPTVPNSPQEIPETGSGSDLGATKWAHLPYSVIEHRSIFQDGELPLWNRYTHCGSPLLGQGQSMLGDPLHWIPIAAGGAAWAWDVKFCLAKWLFAFGVALVVRAVTGRLWLAALLAVSSSFLGYFAYRFNHCAIFSFCYAPWILLCWLRVARTPGRLWPWALAVAAANFWELNSGTVKEAVMIIAGVNLTGCMLVLAARDEWRSRFRRLGAMMFGLVLFVLLGAPHWLVFLDALRHAWTIYTVPKAYQIQPGLLIGIFDDLFYRQNSFDESHFNPSANFLVLLGCLWAAVDIRRLSRDRTFAAILAGAGFHAAIVFGVVPPGFIARLPLLGSIQHVDDTFSCALILHLLVIAAFGLRSLWNGAKEDHHRGDAMIAALLLAVLAAGFFGYAQAAHRAGHTLFHAGETLPFSAFFLGYVTALGIAILALPWIVRSLRVRPSAGAFVTAALCLFMLHFRHGMWTATKFDDYVMNPQSRSDLAAPSRAVEGIKTALARSGEPGRVAGLGGVLVPGFNAVPGLEHFSGADALLSPWQRELAEKTGMPLAWGWRWLLPRDGFPRAKVFGDFWNIRWYLGTPSEQPRTVQGLKFVRTLDLDIYASPTAWPRAFFTNQLAECASLDNFVTLLGAADGRPFAADVPKMAVNVPPAKPDALEGRTIIAAGEYRLTSNSTSFTINAPTPGIAVLGESYEPGNWRVTLDGRPVDCFRVNYAFMGVALSEPGVHKLRFVYWPRVLTPALWMALAGLLLAAGTAYFGMRRRDPAEEAAPESAG
jgi:hypothetical protein